MKVGYFIYLASKTKNFEEIRGEKLFQKLLKYNYSNEISLSFLKQLKYLIIDVMKLESLEINQQFRNKGVYLSYLNGELIGSWFEERYAYINSILYVLRKVKKVAN